MKRASVIDPATQPVPFVTMNPVGLTYADPSGLRKRRKYEFAAFENATAFIGAVGLPAKGRAAPNRLLKLAANNPGDPT